MERTDHLLFAPLRQQEEREEREERIAEMEEDGMTREEAEECEWLNEYRRRYPFADMSDL